MPYGVSDAVWNSLPPDDKQRIINSYNAAQKATQQPKPPSAPTQNPNPNDYQPATPGVKIPTSVPATPNTPPVTPATGSSPTPSPSTGSSQGGGTPSTPSTSTSTVPDIDWADVYFGSFGLPSDLKAQIETLGRQYGTSNPDVFQQSALNLIYGSSWFASTYPGFQSGIRAGLFSDTTGYRGYVDELNQVYQQYLGRAVTGSETSQALAEGVTPSLVGQRFQGQAYIGAHRSDIQYVSGAFGTGPLSDADLQALGYEQAGIDSPQGQNLQAALARAQQRFQGIFQGRLATAAPLPQAAQTPDVSA